MTGLGAFGYPKEAGSTNCGSVINRKPILDKAVCEAAATSMGLDDVTAYEFSHSSYPPGCYWWGSSLHYNTDFTSTASCTAYSGFCLCIAAPDCTHTNGATENTATCMCGGTGCTTASGRFCTSSTSTCSSGDFAPAPAPAPAPASSVPYFVQSSGTCASNNGMKIDTPTECGEAAQALGFADTTASVISHSSYSNNNPGGCFRRDDHNHKLYFNHNFGSSRPCSHQFECICKTEPGGDAPAPAPMVCCINSFCC